MRQQLAQTPDKTLVMGIVNVTPDSFSDGGRYFRPEEALNHAETLAAEGADVIDIGAESTRPDSIQLTSEEEIRRLEPVLSELRQRVSLPISVDTYHAKTASFALEHGADIINDVWGGLADPDILSVVAKSGCEYIYMHNRKEPTDDDIMRVLLAETERGIAMCLEAGIPQRKLWIDPGIGFGKTFQQNLKILGRMEEYCELGYPVLLGTSRKSVVGKTLDVPVGERLEGSLATVAVGVMKGVQSVRVHDAKSTVRTCRMVEAIIHAS